MPSSSSEADSNSIDKNEKSPQNKESLEMGQILKYLLDPLLEFCLLSVSQLNLEFPSLEKGKEIIGEDLDGIGLEGSIYMVNCLNSVQVLFQEFFRFFGGFPRLKMFVLKIWNSIIKSHFYSDLFGFLSKCYGLLEQNYHSD